ncbi:hypothetical protein K474DRAFT_1238324 [Panus rudis PR-1116 ss-1]|nr:hypothetical protein K474DRAFT_1238324 [Panus rudis PR-1116 ss-1]
MMMNGVTTRLNRSLQCRVASQKWASSPASGRWRSENGILSASASGGSLHPNFPPRRCALQWLHLSTPQSSRPRGRRVFSTKIRRISNVHRRRPNAPRMFRASPSNSLRTPVTQLFVWHLNLVQMINAIPLGCACGSGAKETFLGYPNSNLPWCAIIQIDARYASRSAFCDEESTPDRTEAEATALSEGRVKILNTKSRKGKSAASDRGNS